MIMRLDPFPPDWIDAPWWIRLGAPMRADELTRQAWIADLASRWHLILASDEKKDGAGSSETPPAGQTTV